MKKSLYVLLLLIAASLSIATAQTEKGRWTVGVNVGSFVYQNNSSTRTFTGNLAPSAGYFIANNLLIGTGVPLSLSTSKQGPNSFLAKSVTTGFGLSPFVRYYFGKSALKPYSGISYSYTSTRYTYKISSASGNDASGSGYSTALVPTLGVAYFINRNVALNGGFNYNILKNKFVNFSPISASTPSGISSFTLESKLLSLNVGFQLFFGE